MNGVEVKTEIAGGESSLLFLKAFWVYVGEGVCVVVYLWRDILDFVYGFMKSDFIFMDEQNPPCL